MESKIVLTSDTKLSDLLAAYPWLKESLANISEKFKMLNTPLGKVMAKKATIQEMSKRSGVDESVLIERLQLLLTMRGT